MTPAIQQKVQEWLDGPYDKETKEAIRSLSPQELADAFFKEISFGTGGMRGVMGVGPNRMNIYTVQRATQGIANYLKKHHKKPHPVFIGYDVRHHSKEFAQQAARVLAGNGIGVWIAKEVCPTPLTSFACRHLGASAAILITASHNPPQYNGYKVYWEDGAQVVAPHDIGIMKEAHLVQEVLLADLQSPLIEWIGTSIDTAYLKKLAEHPLAHPKEKLQIIYSNLHGTGIRLIPKALHRFGTLSFVEEQKPLDGNFPAAPSPNPEEESAMRPGIQQLLATRSDLFIATDPDADRVGVAIRVQDQAIRLTGNHTACLCLYHICTHLKPFPKHAGFVKTIVTSELFKAIAESFGGVCIDVLTGFKYIAEQMRLWEKSDMRYIYGAEESYGSLYGTFVRDKDAISTSCLIAEMAALAKQQGYTLLDLLYQLYQQYGIHREALTSLTFSESQSGMEEMAKLMQTLRSNPPSHICGKKITTIEDYLKPTGLPKSDVLRFWLQDKTKIVIRTSGTEPKIKIYAEVIEKGASDIIPGIARCDQRLKELIQTKWWVTK
ncbi:MAG: phospho-sugar mutase [Chlamydiia bacterium]|nr:phospho-sugar mutase [Chlamydiia bacterium]